MNPQELRRKVLAIPLSESVRAGIADLLLGVVNTLTQGSMTLAGPELGEVWLTSSGRVALVADDTDSEDPTLLYAVHLQDHLFVGCDAPPAVPFATGETTSAYTYWGSRFWVEKLAESPMEFYANRTEILADLVTRWPRPEDLTAPAVPKAE